ncbi:MAG: oligopeptide transporter, OPT family [Firmicutes bacterium]|nr:oligopeptide transporter, OPT family [Bacillota bacterium]
MEIKNPNASGFGTKVSGADYEPYIAADSNVKEFTVRAVIIGALLAIVFGAANAYLAMQVGMTICASIPAAVMGLAILKIFTKDSTVLENNIIQTVGSAGEALAAGVAFTLPALLLLNLDISMLTVFFICAGGGLLGCLMMVPLRKFLIKDLHGELPYPEGTACAEVVASGHEGGSGAKLLFSALGIGAVWKFITDGFIIVPYTIDVVFSKGPLAGGAVGMDYLGSLLGAGFLIGPRVCMQSLAGAVLGWFGFLPLLHFIGTLAPDMILAPSDIPLSEMGIWDMWTSYLKYLGIGAVTMGAFISLFTALPIIIRSFKHTFGHMGNKEEGEVKRTDLNIGGKVLIIGILIVMAIIAFLPVFPSVLAGSIGAIMVVIFGFIFVTVSAHLVGYVGSTNNPIVAMSIGGLLITAVVFRLFGFNGVTGIAATVVVGSMICIALAISGDMAQDLKSGFLLGATPQKQQIGQMIGIVAAAAVMGAVIIMLNDVYGIGSEKLPAPHANMVKSIAEGIMGGTMPWSLIICGMAIAVMVWLLGGSVLVFAVGLYLPIHLSTTLMIGGAIRGIVDKKYDGEVKAKKVEKGTIYASGMIAGESLMGVIVTVLSYVGVNVAGVLGGWESGWAGMVGFAIFTAIFVYIVISKKEEDKLQGRDIQL